MAIKEKDNKPSISAAPVAITTPAKPASQVARANSAQPPLKATTETRLKPETVAVNPSLDATPAAPEDVAFKRFMQLSLMDNKRDVTVIPVDEWVKNHATELGNDFKPSDPIDKAYAEFRAANTSDRDITAKFEATAHTPFIYNPRTSFAGKDASTTRPPASPNAIIDDGFKVPAFKLSNEQARTELAKDIRTVSEMYAPDAGISAKDFAKVMGGIATIESRFGVLREVKGTKYPSSAGGAFHYLNGTIAGEVRQSMNDPRISGRVAALGVSVNDGVSKSEAWTLKDDNVLAGSILAKRIVETIRKNPELKNDIAALTTRVYQAHNLGDAGANALARGGRQALENLDHKADDNNPMFFKGTKSDAEVNARYQKFVTGAIASANPLIDTAFNGAQPTTIVAASKANLRTPAPEPS